MFFKFLDLGEPTALCILGFIACVFVETILRRIIPMRNILFGGLSIIGFSQLFLVWLTGTGYLGILIIVLCIAVSTVLSYKITSKVEASTNQKKKWSLIFIGWNGFSFGVHILLDIAVFLAVYNAFKDG